MKKERVYMLRHWCDENSKFCHLSLKDIHSGEVRFFHSGKKLLEFLDQQIKKHLPEQDEG